MKKILVFGAGKSATILIRYLVEKSKEENWFVTVIDADIELARSKTGDAANAKALSFDINDKTLRDELISTSDIVISLLPPALHKLVASSCLELSRNLLTASYVDEDMKKMQAEIEQKGLLFLCEMGLDPGIDHMSALQIIHSIRAVNGKITSFKSHCGGLVAPESDDNPWHYKISWNPRNILMAGKSGAVYRENGREIKLPYEQLFTTDRIVDIPGLGNYCWYPNRDSLSYISLYDLDEAKTFVRTTLRHPDFMYGWKNVIEMKLTDETPRYETDDAVLMDLFRQHLVEQGFGDWLEKKFTERFEQTKQMLEGLMDMLKKEYEQNELITSASESMLMVDKKGALQNLDLDELKENAAHVVAEKMKEARLTLQQLFYLGLDDDKTPVPKGKYSAADIMQIALEKKLALLPLDKDMIVMLHELEFEKDRQQFKTSSSLVVKGEDSVHTAMAKTVGLPLGIAARLILNGTIRTTGLQIPVSKEIYEPVMAELKEHGIQFQETTQEL